jgi:hypothetical protein
VKVAKAKGRLRGKQPKLKPNQAKICSNCTTSAAEPGEDEIGMDPSIVKSSRTLTTALTG